MAPADVPKSGSSFDLPIALGILASLSIVPPKLFESSMFVGELSLEGHVRKVPGIIPLTILAKEKGIKNIFLPDGNKEEASILDDVIIYPVSTLQQIIKHLQNVDQITPFTSVYSEVKEPQFLYDFSTIKGQEQAKRALEIAAAGFHNISLSGPPGGGKTLLSRSFSSILPPMDRNEMLEVAKIYSVVGQLIPSIFQGVRPFRSPHHTTSQVGLIGGGTHPSPGEISLAHRGVLFLDEFPEFPRYILESMRQPLEDGIVTVSRAMGSVTYPARFLLLAASNPCPCGFLHHPKKECICAPGTVSKYKKRLSGPILDRIDIHLEVPPVEVDQLTDNYVSESSKIIRNRVIAARRIQIERFKDSPIHFNSEMKSSEVNTLCLIERGAKELLNRAVDKLSLSARSYFKTIKVAQTIADLEYSDNIKEDHIGEALQYRVKDI
jgi:magnesium chelatase family protein